MKKGVGYKALAIIVLFLLIAICFLNYKYQAFPINRSIAIPERSLSIMTFNIDAIDSAKFTENFRNRLLEIIVENKPDVVCFQELTFENLEKIKPRLDSIFGPCEVLQRDDQLWRLRFYSHFRLRNFKRYKCTDTISTNEFGENEMTYYTHSQQQMNVMSAEFEIEPERWVTVFSGHLRSSAYSTARRSMDKDANWFDGVSLYKRNYEIGKSIRDYEARNVRRFIDEERNEGKSVILAGDLNDWSGSDCLNTLMGNDMKDAWWEGGKGFGWTYFGWHMRLRLDHILYSDELELVDVKVIDSDLSDHKPLMAKFRFK